MMKVYIMVDFEGATGVASPSQAISEGYTWSDFGRFRRLWMDDINAMIEGALDAGASEFLVNEGHHHQTFIIPDMLRPEAEYISGFIKPNMQMCSLDNSFNAVFLFSHAGVAYSNTAVLSHTWLGREIHDFRLNGKTVGETHLNAALAGYYDVPVALVVGDRDCCIEAKEALPNVVTAETKVGIDRWTARCTVPQITQKRIKKAAKESIENIDEVKPYKIKTPIQLEIEFQGVSMATLCCYIPGVKRKDPRTIVFTDDDFQTVYNCAFACVMMTLVPKVRDTVY